MSYVKDRLSAIQGRPGQRKIFVDIVTRKVVSQCFNRPCRQKGRDWQGWTDLECVFRGGKKYLNKQTFFFVIIRLQPVGSTLRHGISINLLPCPELWLPPHAFHSYNRRLLPARRQLPRGIVSLRTLRDIGGRSSYRLPFDVPDASQPMQSRQCRAFEVGSTSRESVCSLHANNLASIDKLLLMADFAPSNGQGCTNDGKC